MTPSHHVESRRFGSHLLLSLSQNPAKLFSRNLISVNLTTLPGSESYGGSRAYGSKRHSLQSVELSQRTQAAVLIVSNLPVPSNGGSIYRFWACRPCGPAGWLALLLTKAGDVDTNAGPTILNKQFWIWDICHKQIHVRKQISIRCNRIEH